MLKLLDAFVQIGQRGIDAVNQQINRTQRNLQSLTRRTYNVQLSFNQAIANQIQRVQNLFNNLASTRFGQFSRTLGAGMTQSLRILGNAARTTAGALGGLVVALRTVFGVAGIGLATGLISLASTLVTVGTRAQELQAQRLTIFEQVTGSARAAEASLRLVDRSVQNLGRSYDDLSQKAKLLLETNTEFNQIEGDLRRIQAVSDRTGGSFEKIARILGDLRNNRIAGFNELIGLEENGVAILNRLATELGITRSEVLRLATESEIGSLRVIQAFRAIGDETRTQATSIGNEVTKIRENINQLTQAFGVRDIATGTLTAFNDSLLGVRGLLREAQHEVGNLVLQFQGLPPITRELRASLELGDERAATQAQKRQAAQRDLLRLEKIGQKARIDGLTQVERIESKIQQFVRQRETAIDLSKRFKLDSDFAVERFDIAIERANQELIKAKRNTDEYREAQRKANEAAREQERIQKRIQQITESVDPIARFRNELRELQQLRNLGQDPLGLDAFNRAVEAARKRAIEDQRRQIPALDLRTTGPGTVVLRNAPGEVRSNLQAQRQRENAIALHKQNNGLLQQLLGIQRQILSAQSKDVVINNQIEAASLDL